MNEYLAFALSGAGGATCVAIIAKWAIGRSLKQFEEMITTLHSIEKRLAAIDVQLFSTAKLHDLVQEHDRDIASLRSLVEAYSGRSTQVRNKHQP